MVARRLAALLPVRSQSARGRPAIARKYTTESPLCQPFRYPSELKICSPCLNSINLCRLTIAKKCKPAYATRTVFCACGHRAPTCPLCRVWCGN